MTGRLHSGVEFILMPGFYEIAFARGRPVAPFLSINSTPKALHTWIVRRLTLDSRARAVALIDKATAADYCVSRVSIVSILEARPGVTARAVAVQQDARRGSVTTVC